MVYIGYTAFTDTALIPSISFTFFNLIIFLLPSGNAVKQDYFIIFICHEVVVLVGHLRNLFFSYIPNSYPYKLNPKYQMPHIPLESCSIQVFTSLLLISHHFSP